jgi:hypothetical protein
MRRGSYARCRAPERVMSATFAFRIRQATADDAGALA